MTQQPIPVTIERRSPSLFYWIIATVASKAAMNHYHVTGDWKVAVNRGIGAFVRMVSWFLLAACWAGGFVVIENNATIAPQQIDIVRLWLALVTPVFGILWCRNGDYCLFRRGPVQWIFGPIARLVEGVPTLLLYLFVLVPVVAGGLL